jgi:RHS repeat-associated protein
MASFGPDSTTKKWAGQHEYQADLPLGLSHVGARQYDSFTGRFLNRDPIGFAGGLNLYGYCDNDPVNAVDPSGLAPWQKWIAPVVRFGRTGGGGGAAGALVGVTVHAVSDLATYEPGGNEGQWWRITYHMDRRAQKWFAGGDVPANPAFQRLWAMARNSGRGGGKPCRGAQGAEDEPEAAPQPAEGGAGARRGGNLPGGGGPPRKRWTLTDEKSSGKRVVGGRTYVKHASTGLWWSRDTAGHGGSAFKVYKELPGGTLEWIADADEFGNYISGKHKGPIGRRVGK